MLLKFFLKSIVAPFAATVAAKAGEAVGDLVAFHINPPAPDQPEPEPEPETEA